MIKERQFRIVMFIIAGALMVGVIAGIANAAVNTGIKWEQPLFYEDGEAMSPSDIDVFEIHYAVDEDISEMEDPQIVKGSERSFSVELELMPRPEPYTVAIGVKTVTIYGTKSMMSEPVLESFSVDSTKVPARPINVRISFRCEPDCEVNVIVEDE